MLDHPLVWWSGKPNRSPVGEKLSGASKAAKLDAPATRGHVLLGVLLCIVVICFLHLSEEPAADTPSMAAGNDGGGTAAVHY